MVKKIIIFDLDGTLLDTSIPHLLALKKLKVLFDIESGFFNGSSLLLNIKKSLKAESDTEKAIQVYQNTFIDKSKFTKLIIPKENIHRYNTNIVCTGRDKKTTQYLIKTFYPGYFDELFSFEDFEKTDFIKAKKELDYLLMTSNNIEYWGDTESDKQLANFLNAKFYDIKTFEKNLEI